MSPAFFIVVTDANFVPILAADGPSGTNLIQGSVSIGGWTSYITGNLTPPGTRLYAARQNADGSFIVTQSKLSGYPIALMTFFGWNIPA